MNMKSFPSGFPSSLLGQSFRTAAILLLASAALSYSQNSTWTGASGGDWDTSSNWAASTKPGAAGNATFNSSLSSVTNSSANQTVGSILFTTNAGTASGTFTIGSTGGNSLTLANAGTIQVQSGLTGTGKSISINAPIILTPASSSTAGTYSFRNDNTDSTNTLNFGGSISGGTTTATETLTLRGVNTGNNTVSGNISNGSAATLALTKTDAGTWTLSGNNTYTGATTISAGTLRLGSATALPSGTGAISIASGATLDLNGQAWVLPASAGNTTVNLTNSGTISGNLTISAPASGPILVQGNTAISGFATLNAGSVTGNIVNNGQLSIAGATAVTTGTISSTATGSNGTGAISYLNTTAGGNTLTFADGTSLTGIAIGANAVGTLTTTGTVNLFGYGHSNNTTVNAFNMTFNGGTWNIGQLGQGNSGKVAGGTTNILGGAQLNVAVNTSWLNYGSNSAGAGAMHGIYNIGGASSGTLVLTGSVAEAGGITGTPAAGAINGLQINVGNNGTLTQNGTGNFTLGTVASGGQTVNTTNSLTVNSGGVANIGGGILFIGNTALNHTATETNRVAVQGGTLNQTGGVISLGGSAATSGNTANELNVSSGTLNIGTSATARALQIGTASNAAAAITNTVSLSGGKIVLNGLISAFSGTNQANSFNWTGGQLTATTITASSNFAAGSGSAGGITQTGLVNNGANGTTLAPGDTGFSGRMTINGTYVQGSNGTLALDIGGTSASTVFQNAAGGSYDNVVVSGAATLGGTLTANLISGYTPTNASSFTILTAASVSGAFTNPNNLVVLTNDPFSGSLTINVNPTNVVLNNWTPNQWQGGGNWGTGGTAVWTNAVDPNGAGVGAAFSSTGVTNNATTVTLDAERTVGQLIFSGSTGYTLNASGAGALTLNNNASAAVFTLSTAAANTLNVPLTLSSDLTVSGFAGGSIDLAGNISGSGRNITTSTAGTLILSGTNTYANTTIGTGTTLQVGNGGTTGSLGSGTIGNNGTLRFNRSDSYGGTLSTVVSGTGGLAVASGTLSLGAANTYTGQTTVASGATLVLAAGGGDGTSGVLGTTAAGTIISSGGVLDLNGQTIGAEALTLNGSGIANGGALVNGSASAATYAGLLTLGSSSQINALSGNITLSNTGSITGSGFGLTVDGAFNTTIAGILATGTGSVTKDGAGVLTMTGSNTYTGGVTLNAGTLNINTNGSATVGALGNQGAFTINGGTIDNTSGAARSVANVNALVFGGDFAFSTGAGTALNNLTLPGAATLTGNRVITSNGAGTLTFSGAIGDSGSGYSLTKNGSGGLTLSGANTYTGGTTLNAGTLNINTIGVAATSGPLGNGGTFTINGGTIDNTSGAARIVANVNALVFGGDFAFSTGSGTTSNNLTLPGAATLSGNRTITANGAGVLTFSGVINDTPGVASIAKEGAGALSLGGLNTFRGGFNLNAGTLVLLNSTPTSSGATVTAGAVGTGDLTIAAGTTVRGAAANNPTFTATTTRVNGSFSVDLSSTRTSWGSDWVMTGTPQINLTNAGSPTFATVIGASGGSSTLRLGSVSSLSAVAAAGTQTITGPLTVDAGSVSTIAGLQVGANTTLNFANNGSLTVGNKVLMSFATASAFLGTGTNAAALTIQSGGYVSLSSSASSYSQTVHSLSGAGILTNLSTGNATATLTIANGNGADFTGTIQDGSTVAGTGITALGRVAVTKSGSGTQTLSGANTYTGNTIVNAGTLLVNGSTSASSAVSVNNTGTLGGSGTVAGTVSINNGGTLSPGNSPGELATGSQTWAVGGDYNWQIFDATGLAGTGFDTVNVTGTLNLGSLTAGSFGINLWSLSSALATSGNAINFDGSSDYSWALVSTTAGVSGFEASDFAINLGSINGTSGFTNTAGGVFSLALSGDSQTLLLNYSAIPEPSSWALFALGLTLVGVCVRRRQTGGSSPRSVASL